jgi:outer membrane protein OmpA-like peptidoglycan-associated protein
MNRFGIFAIVLAAATACAQDQSQPQSATQPTAPTPQTAKPAQPQVAATNRPAVSTSPTMNDMYCSGFVIQGGLPQRAGRVAGGWDSPFQNRFSGEANLNSAVYLDRGSFSKDQQFMVVRPVRDVNRYELTPRQFKNLKAAGDYFLEIGRVKVVDVQKGIGIARSDFSCDAIEPGDVLLPWADRQVPQFRRDTPWDFWAQPNGKTTGTLLMGREFDGLAGQRGKVYVNIGSSQGIKTGDYLRVTRTYAQMQKDPADNQSNQASIVDYEHKEPIKEKITLHSTRYNDFPRKSIGELMVLYTTPTTATATVTRSWEQLQAGDGVELMEEPPPAPEPVAAAAPMNPPTVTCTATPASVHIGENATIRCAGSSPDNRDLSYAFSSDAGAVTGKGETAVLNTANAQPGVATVNTIVSDDRGQTGTTATRVNIEQAPAPTASDAGSLTFKPNGAYVNNQAKAILDQVALRLQREAGSTAMLVGYIEGKEASRLAIARATNAKNYLVNEKGIDTSRVQVADGGPGGAKVQVWFVPAGATMPQITPQQPQQ